MAKCLQSSRTGEQDRLDGIWTASSSNPSKLHGQRNTASVNPHHFNYSIKNSFFFLSASRIMKAGPSCHHVLPRSCKLWPSSAAVPSLPPGPAEGVGVFVPRGRKGLQGHVCIVQDRGAEERLLLTGLRHGFLWMSLLLLTISCALLGISHLAEALVAFQALELAVHMSPLYVTVHPRRCRCMFWLFRFVCVTGLTQPLRGF